LHNLLRIKIQSPLGLSIKFMTIITVNLIHTN